MTKAELIRKMSKRSGVPDSEAKIFFEIFLKRISVILKPGEAVKINSFGYFQFRKAVVQSMLTTTAEKISTDYSDLIVFSPLTEEAGEKGENLIFNIPSYLIENENYNQLDSYFSISIGKPVIPLKDVKDNEYFVPPTSSELRKLIETKVEKLLQGAEVITKHTKGNEYLIIKPELKGNDQFELPWDSKTESKKENKKEKEVDDKTDEQTTGFNHIAWDFGEDLSRQLEEESILDVGVEPEEKIQNEENETDEDVSWEFGAGIEDDEDINAAIDEVKNNDLNSDNIINTTEEKVTGDNVIEEEIKDDEPEQGKQPDNFTTREFEERVAEDLQKYQRVKAITREFIDEPVEDELQEDIDWDFGKEETDFNEIENLVNNFEEKQKKDLYKTFTEDEVSLEEKDIEELYKEKEKDESENSFEKDVKENKPTIPSNSNKTGDKKYSKDYLTSTKSRKYSYSGRSSSLVFFIALGTILAVGVVLFLFLKNVNVTGIKTKNTESEKVMQASVPEVINRTFNIPVTYPYLKSNRENEPEQTGINEGALNSKSRVQGEQPAMQKSNLSSLLGNTKAPEKKTSVKKAPEIKPRTASSNTKVSGNIYKSGNSYIVQVSSWHTKSIAERQANRFKSAGYNAFIEKAEIPGRGTWYRVRVGNFNSLAEAENFSKRFK